MSDQIDYNNCVDPHKLRAELEKTNRKRDARMANNLTESAAHIVQALSNAMVDGINLRIERERLAFVMRTQALWFQEPYSIAGSLEFVSALGCRTALRSDYYENAIDKAMKREATNEEHRRGRSAACAGSPQALREPNAGTSIGI